MLLSNQKQPKDEPEAYSGPQSFYRPVKPKPQAAPGEPLQYTVGKMVRNYPPINLDMVQADEINALLDIMEARKVLPTSVPMKIKQDALMADKQQSRLAR